MALLSGCATEPSEKPACPQEQVYSDAFLNKLADEVEALPDNSPLLIIVIDYKSLRNGAKACRGEKVEKER
jgi:hypothetical protein